MPKGKPKNGVNRGWFKKGNKPIISDGGKKKLSQLNKDKRIENWKNPDYRKRMSDAHKNKTGEKSSNWKGGISKDEKYVKKRMAKWKQENKDKQNLYRHRRRAKKIGSGGSHTLGEWENLKAQYDWTCPSCKIKEPRIKLSKDHIIPISKGGSDNIENIQPLCVRCNQIKHTKIIKY